MSGDYLLRTQKALWLTVLYKTHTTHYRLALEAAPQQMRNSIK